MLKTIKECLIFFIITWFCTILVVGCSKGAYLSDASNDSERISDCSRFTLIDVFFPITPLACVLSKQIYP